jgi:LacI family transcriptional regulator
MSVTLKDIAKATGYSVITISRVLTNPSKVKEKTRLTIQKAIAEAGYHPNNVARALVSKRTNIIYVYIPADLTVNSPFFVQVVAGIGEGLGNLGYSMLLKRTWYDGEASDGVILMGLSEEDDSRLSDLTKQKKVVVFGNNELANCIDVNNRLGMAMAGDYAFANGYRHLAYASIAQERKFIHDRENGFFDSVRRQGLNPQDCPLVSVPNNEVGGYEAGLKLLKKKDRPDCVVCASDDIAIGLLRAAKELNISVPGELGITGFDGLGSELISHPRLTTIHQPIYEVGKELAKFIVSELSSNGSGQGVKTIFYAPVLYKNETISPR